MQLNQFLENIKYIFTSSEKYEWKAFGKHARYLDSQSLDGNNSITCIFNSKTLVVYQVEIYFYGHKYFRWINPDVLQDTVREHKKKKQDFYLVAENNTWCNVESEQDILFIVKKYFKLLNKQ